MADASTWWEGRTQAILMPGKVMAIWGLEAGSADRIAIANRAFEVYYRGMRCVNDLDSRGEQSKAMRGRLQSLAKSGWGLGVADLEDAFSHLAKHATDWKDEKTADYTGGRDKVFPRSVKGAPLFAVNFLTAVEADFQKFKKTCLETYNEHLSALAALALQKPTNWERVHQTISATNSAAGTAGAFLWYGPPLQKAMIDQGRIVGHGGSSGALDHKLAGIAGRLISYSQVCDYIAGALTDYVKLRRHNLEAFVPLKFALKFIPILGGFYGSAIDAIPAIKSWFVSLMRQYIERIDRLSSDTDAIRHRFAPGY